MYGDPDVIRSLARRLREQAADLEREARDLVAQAAATAWHGLAADAMRRRVRERAEALRRTAALHDEAAVDLERHAREVERLQALIAAVERRVRALVDAARHRLAGLAGLAGDLLGLAPDPVDRLLDRFVPPPPGHRDWLQVDLPGLPDVLGAGR